MRPFCILLLPLAILVGCGKGSGPQPVIKRQAEPAAAPATSATGTGTPAAAETPEAVVERAKAARARQDWAAYVDCLTSQSQFGYMNKCLIAVGLGLNGKGNFHKDQALVADLPRSLRLMGFPKAN